MQERLSMDGVSVGAGKSVDAGGGSVDAGESVDAVGSVDACLSYRVRTPQQGCCRTGPLAVYSSSGD